MRTLIGLATFATIGGALLVVASAVAQPPGRPDGGRGESGPALEASKFITRMMTYDANQDGKLSKDEVTDARLSAIFGRADTDKDGFVTKEEMKTLIDKEYASPGIGGPGGRGPGGGGPGGAGGRGPGGPGGPGGPEVGGPSPISQVLPSRVQDALNLSSDQKASVLALQKDVDKRLAEILTADQRQQLEELKNRGPGGPGGPGGNRGRDGGPGGPPGEPGRPRRPTND